MRLLFLKYVSFSVPNGRIAKVDLMYEVAHIAQCATRGSAPRGYFGFPERRTR